MADSFFGFDTTLPVSKDAPKPLKHGRGQRKHDGSQLTRNIFRHFLAISISRFAFVLLTFVCSKMRVA